MVSSFPFRTLLFLTNIYQVLGFLAFVWVHVLREFVCGLCFRVVNAPNIGVFLTIVKYHYRIKSFQTVSLMYHIGTNLSVVFTFCTKYVHIRIRCPY